ncbi:MAG: AAA family ATPase [Acidobacteriota bacterium]
MLLNSVTLKNILSFKDAQLPLQPLNVFVGPNASGKSNLIEAISLLQALPRDLSAVIRAGGGVREWLWKGDSQRGEPAHVECVLEPVSSGQRRYLRPREKRPVRYVLRFQDVQQNVHLIEERLETVEALGGQAEPYYFARVESGSGWLNVATPGGHPAQRGGKKRELQRGEAGASGSIFAAFRDQVQFPEITHYAKEFDRIRLYREWNLGRRGAPRLPQATDLPNDFLDENAQNLPLVLNRMESDGSLARLEEYLGRFCERFGRVAVKIEGGTVQLGIREKGFSHLIPAMRLSDGTLRFLSLLSVLCNPSPPQLVCIEEPELGLHPDAVRLIAEALIEASGRMQLIVTTHSEDLVDALQPDAIVVCEFEEHNGTRFRRLNRDELEEWLKDYTLGELWRKGEVGGRRW